MILSGANTLTGLTGSLDAHAHVFLTSLPLAAERRYTPVRDAPLTDYAHLLEQERLAGGLLVQPSFLGTDNSFLCAALRDSRYGGGPAMRGVAVLAPDAGDGQLADLSGEGVVGLRLNLMGEALDRFDLDTWRGLLRRADAADWHLEIHAPGAWLGRHLAGFVALSSRVVVDHFGMPAPEASLDCPGLSAICAAPHGRVFVKVAAPYRVFPASTSDSAARLCQPVFNRLLGVLGPGQLMWGSDWPFTQCEGRHTYADTVRWQREWLEAA